MKFGRWIVVGALLTGLGGCGSDDAQETPAARSTELAAVKRYLLDHTERLNSEVGTLRGQAQEYYDLASAAGFDYEAMKSRPEVEAVLEAARSTFKKANPAYEEMEGVVAGVPELADFDVSIDAGGDASDPETAVPFDVTTDAGKVYKQPGNYFFLVETALYGTEPKFGSGVAGLPDARFLLAAAKDFEQATAELGTAAQAWAPTTKDALTALVVMTPTMSEYFEAWKNSRFVAGDKATEKAFVGASRLQDIADILGGLVVIYDNVRPEIEAVDTQQAAQSATELRELHSFAEDLRDQEAGGKRFKAEQADALGSQAQDRAEAIAGQISQAAGKLGIQLET